MYSEHLPNDGPLVRLARWLISAPNSEAAPALWRNDTPRHSPHFLGMPANEVALHFAEIGSDTLDNLHASGYSKNQALHKRYMTNLPCNAKEIMAREFKLLSRLTIIDDGHFSPLMKNAKGCALLAYLIVTGGPQLRETVADLLWESSSTAHSLRNLRVLLTRIRPFLPELKASRQTLAFQAAPDTSIDLYQFNQALSGTELAQLEQALFLYEGHLLEDLHIVDAPRFNEWVLLAREQLRMRVQDVFRQVCEAYAAQEQWRQGIIVCRRWLALDDLNEEACRRLMQMLAGIGEVGAALQQYEACRQRLREELDVEPEAATTELARQLIERQDEVGGIQLPDVAQMELPPPGELAEPGLLPVNACVPYRRNDGFAGREANLLQLAELLLPRPEMMGMGMQPVAITGMGGLGKTQLAVEFCYRYGRFYPGGVFWMSFAEADNVAEEVALTGGERGLALYQEAERLTLADRIGRVQRTWQESIPRLLIFDNCEEGALLSQWLPKTGGCRVLLTSRRANWAPALNIATLPLNVLRRPDSIALLQYLAPDLTRPEASEIAVEMGNLPLALHLAGSFLQRYKSVTVAAYLSQLRSDGLLRHPSLQGRGSNLSPTGHERHITRTFALSLQQFDSTNEIDNMARRLLAHAACLTPGEPIPQELLRATVVSDDDLLTLLLVEDGLMRLIALGFLEAEGRESVVLHRMLAAFVVEVMVAVDALDAARIAVEDSLIRLLDSVLREAIFPGRLPIPVPHLSYVTEMALERSSASAALLALVLGWYLRFAGKYADAQHYLEKGLNLAIATGDVYTQGRIIYILSRLKYSQGFHQEAQQKSITAEQLLRQANMPDQTWLIAALTRHGWTHLRLGQAEPSLAAAAEVRQLCRDTGNKSALIECMNLLGSIQYFLLGDYEAADRTYENALDLAQQINHSNIAAIIMNQGEIANMQGDYGRAKAKVQEALQIAHEAGDQIRELSFTINLGEAQMRLGDYVTAVASLTQVIAQAPKNWTYAPVAYLTLAEAYLGQGNCEEALTAVQAVNSLEADDDPYNTGGSWRLLGHIAFQTGQLIAASTTSDPAYTGGDCFARSLQIFTDIENKREQAVVLWQWAEYELAQGDPITGKRMWQQAREIFVKLNLPLLVASMDNANRKRLSSQINPKNNIGSPDP